MESEHTMIHEKRQKLYETYDTSHCFIFGFDVDAGWYLIDMQRCTLLLPGLIGSPNDK